MTLRHWSRTPDLSGERGAFMATMLPTVDHEVSIGDLTDRELEVLRLIIEGNSSKEAAKLLYLSKRTIDFHLARIYEKLDVSNRVQAIRRATELGLLAVRARIM